MSRITEPLMKGAPINGQAATEGVSPSKGMSMTFNQWAASRGVSAGDRQRYALEDIWNALIGAGKKPHEVARLLDGLFS